MKKRSSGHALFLDSLGLGKPITDLLPVKTLMRWSVWRVDHASGTSAWGSNVAVVFLLFFALVVCMYAINLDLASLSGIAS